VPFIVFNKPMKQLVLDTEYADRLSMMDKSGCGDTAGQINPDQKD